MNVLKRRSRMVSFRLSEQEYQELMSLCEATGSRSLSDLARDAMRRLLDSSAGESPASETEVRRLNGQMERLDREVRRLQKLICVTPGGAEDLR